MALNLIKVNEFPESIDVKNWLVVSDTSGVSYKISKENLKAYLGTVQAVIPKEITLSSPEPLQDGIYLPQQSGTYANAGGINVDLNEGYNQLIRDQDVWYKYVSPIDLSSYLTGVDVKAGGLVFVNGLLNTPSFKYFPNNAWSVEMLIKITDKNTVQGIFNGGQGNPSVIINAGNIDISKSGFATNARVGIQPTWLNEAVFISIIFNGSTYITKVDDVLVTTTIDTVSSFDRLSIPLTIGSFTSGVLPFKGELSLFRIFDYALNASEITEHFNKGTPHLFIVDKNQSLTIELLPENVDSSEWLDTSIYSNSGVVYGSVVSASRKPVLLIEEDSKVQFSGSGTVDFPSFSYFNKITGTIEIDILLRDINSIGVLFFNGEGNPVIYAYLNEFTFGSANIGGILTFDANPFLNTRRSLTITYSGSDYAVYIDGELTVFSLLQDREFSLSAGILTVGSQDGSAGIDGDVYMLRISDMAISAEEVRYRYKSKGATLKDESVMIELYGGNATPSRWYDSSASQMHGTPQGVVVTNSKFPNIGEGTPKGNYLKSIPDQINIVVGKELNLFYKSFIPHYGNQVRINVLCSQGESSERSFRFAPTGTGVYDAVIQVEDLLGNILETKTIAINAVHNNNGSGTKQILCIGDSTTDSYLTDYLGTGREKYEMVREFYDMILGDGGIAPLFLGTNGIAPYRHEGRSGYSIDLFTINNPTYPNPFWDGTKVNFKWWMSNNSNFGGADRIDYIYIQLGINDLKNGENPTIAINRMKTLVGLINNATYGYPSAKIIISQTPYACGDRSGWVTAFKAISDYEKYIHNMVDYAALIVENFHENPSYANVSICPTFLFVDRDYGYPFAMQDASSRSDVKIKQFTDSVHPDKSGYEQAADAYYSKLRSLL